MTATRRFTLPLLTVAATLALAACGPQNEPGSEASSAASTAPEAKPGLSLSNGTLLLPAVKGNPGAAYFTVENQGDAAVSIAAITIDGVAKTEMHQTTGGQMRPAGQVDVPAKATVRFERGGLHVMAFDLDPALQAGGTTGITVTFSDGDKVSAPLKLEAMGGAMGAMEGMKH